jgi:glycosyltransferase involved in cell wall biosynthesis
MNPTISVVIPLYNRPDLIKHVVESVLAQTLPASEIILVNDGSIVDVEGEVRRNMAEKPAWRDRVKYFRQENQGQSIALNNGLAEAKGDWIAFNANDDLWLPQKLEWQFKAIEKFGNECGLCFTDAWFMYNTHMKAITLFEFAESQFTEGMGIIEDPVRLLLHRHPVWCQTVVVRADLVRQVGGYDPLMRFSEDYDFVFQLALLTKFCYVGMPMVLIDRTPSPTRHMGAGLNWQKKEFKLRMDERRLEKQLKLTAGLAPDIQKAARANMRAHYSKWTNLYLKNEDYAKAREAISIAAKYDLTPGVAVKWVLTRLSPHLARKITLRREDMDPTRDFGLNW